MAGNKTCNDNLTIEDLPIEMLYAILKRVGDDDDDEYDLELENVRQVCQRWYFIVDAWIGMEVVVTSNPTPMVIHPSNPDLSKAGLELVSEIGVRKLCVGQDDHLEVPSTTLPSFKYPYLLRSIDLYGSLHSDLFNSLMKGTVNLSKFDISFRALTQMRNTDLQNLNFRFPRLRTLHVQAWFLVEQNEVVCSVALPNLRTLLTDNRFPWLTCLFVKFFIETFEDLGTLKDLLSFIHGHPGIQDLSAHMQFSRDLHRSANPQAYEEDMKTLISEIKGRENCRSLKILNIFTDQVRRNDYPQWDIWKEFLLKQTSLQALHLNIGQLSYAELKTLAIRSRSTVEELRISDKINTEGIRGHVDLSAISPLQRLHTLALYQKFVEFTGARHLPSSLAEINIDGILRSEEVDYILLNLPNLRTVIYWDQHDHPDDSYAVRVSTLEQVVQNRRIQTLSLGYNCVPSDFPQDGISNGDPVNPISLKCIPHPGIYWTLRRSGYYSC